MQHNMHGRDGCVPERRIGRRQVHEEVRPRLMPRDVVDPGHDGVEHGEEHDQAHAFPANRKRVQRELNQKNQDIRAVLDVHIPVEDKRRVHGMYRDPEEHAYEGADRDGRVEARVQVPQLPVHRHVAAPGRPPVPLIDQRPHKVDGLQGKAPYSVVNPSIRQPRVRQRCDEKHHDRPSKAKHWPKPMDQRCRLKCALG
ncbi:hypothetical protein H257_15782 [Aphanomyces astaci]|uniref:Uncharacterized protein n=1 Tax=Aphanomyces astaci TaxID=112090 RepID=W4FL15_APHAT|nr:hypothetical protein H257_15782 [Aphanomyces astaci]ETV68202.1 hypothetical protein H257_15782 [Aphanomyces astaci]|eukprot:XP_009842287.1 hypothetical protein H257_15782 [Aphanomyces astaci]